MKKITFLLFTTLLTLVIYANNITVSTATLSNQNTTAHIEIITFSAAWENSWRTSTNENNYDGAWIFVKFRKMGTTDWRHCTIATTGFTPATGAAISVTADGKGAFLYKATDGVGNVNYVGNQIIWNYGVDGILDNETVEIRLFGLEMVYVPTGSFKLGSGGSEVNAFKDGTTAAIPYTVLNNGAINIGTAAGNLNSDANLLAGTIPATFPKGFSAFWVMKYECSQQQYADFLNHLDNARAIALYVGTLTGTNPNYIAPQPERAMGSIGYMRNSAIADWSGLRPMSEMEFEKACRGFNTPAVPNEYAWGNTGIIPLSSVTNSGLTNETVALPTNANATIASVIGVITRVGLFARVTASDRTVSGGTYYGIMNMSDNLVETVINAGTSAGRLIIETVHGDGYLSASGFSDITVWQANNSAFGYKGSSLIGSLNDARVSDRQNVAFYSPFINDNNAAQIGCRLVRTAP